LKDIADHFFDIFENSVNAKANEVIIKISFSENIFYCPFVTSRTTRKVGLGLPLLKKTAEDTGGYLKIKRANPGGGTKLEFEIDMSHIDAKPFGDLAQAFTDIYFSWPEVDLKLYIIRNSKAELVLDFKKLRDDEKKGLSDSIRTRRKILDIMQEELKNLNIE